MSLFNRQFLPWLALCLLALQLSACAVQRPESESTEPADRHRQAAERIQATMRPCCPSSLPASDATTPSASTG